MNIEKDTTNNAFIISGIFDGTLRDGVLQIPINGTSLDIDSRDIVTFKDSVSGDVYTIEKLTRILYNGSPVTKEELNDIFDEIATGESGSGPGPGPQPEPKNWLKIVNLTNTEGTISLNKDNSPYNITLKTSTDGSHWTEHTISETTNFTLPANGYVAFDGTANAAFANGPYDSWRFSCDVQHKVSGNINTLVADNFNTYYTFSNLFTWDEQLINADELILPWINLTGAQGIYFQMFNYCRNLTTAPALPATVLSDECYQMMFADTQITVAPALPATVVPSHAYMGLFRSTPISTAPVLNITEVGWQGCTEMFAGCNNLTTAPALPATVLNGYAYQGMFANCYNLTTAPILVNAVLMNEGNYESMFSGCSSLSYLKCLSENTGIATQISDWLSNVAATGTLECAAAMSEYYPENSGSGVPVGWTILDPLPQVNVSPNSWAIGSLTTLGTFTQTFTLTNIDPSDTTWTYTASNNDANYSYSASGNTLTVTYTVDSNSVNHNIDNELVFSHTGNSRKKVQITGDVVLPDVVTNYNSITFADASIADTSTLTVVSPSGYSYALSGPGSTYLTVTQDPNDNTQLIIDYDGLAPDSTSASLTISKTGYISKEVTIGIGDEIIGHGCHRVEYIQTNGQREYLNTGVLLPADSQIELDTLEIIGGQGNYTLSSRWADNANDYDNYYPRIFTTGGGFYWDLISDNYRFNFNLNETCDDNRYTVVCTNNHTNSTRDVSITWLNSGVTQTDSTSGSAYGPQSYPLLWTNYLECNYADWTPSTPGAYEEPGVQRRLYSLKVRDLTGGGNTLIFDAVPVVKNVDNKPGVYDYISHQFIPCNGPVNMTYKEYPDTVQDPFTVTNLTNAAGTFNIIAQNYSSSLSALEFDVSDDNGATWTNYRAIPNGGSLSVALSLNLPANGSLRIVGANAKFSTSSDVWKFGCDVDYAVSGRISTLATGDNNGYTFQHMFANTHTIGNTHVVDASALIIDSMDYNCYNGMFDGCSNLIYAPILDLAIVSARAYYEMFVNCPNITYVKCLGTNIEMYGVFHMVENGSATGTLECAQGMTQSMRDNAAVPSTWTIVEI